MEPTVTTTSPAVSNAPLPSADSTPMSAMAVLEASAADPSTRGLGAAQGEAANDGGEGALAWTGACPEPAGDQGALNVAGDSSPEAPASQPPSALDVSSIERRGEPDDWETYVAGVDFDRLDEAGAALVPVVDRVEIGGNAPTDAVVEAVVDAVDLDTSDAVDLDTSDAVVDAVDLDTSDADVNADDSFAAVVHSEAADVVEVVSVATPGEVDSAIDESAVFTEPRVIATDDSMSRASDFESAVGPTKGDAAADIVMAGDAGSIAEFSGMAPSAGADAEPRESDLASAPTLDAELASFRLTPQEVVEIPAPIPGLGSPIGEEDASGDIDDDAPIAGENGGVGATLAERDDDLRAFVARSEAQAHAAATVEAVARRIRRGEIVPATEAGASPEAVLASVLASLLCARP